MRREMLVSARRAAGKTQEQVARLVGVDRTTLGKWERDETTPHPYQRLRYAEALGITLDELDAMLSSIPRETNEMPEWLTTYLGMEQSATRLRAYEPRAVYGLLQTPAYVEHLARGLCLSGVSDSYIREMVAQRLYRQKRIRDGSLMLDVVQPESVLHLRVGSPAVMTEQLRAILELAALPNVALHITTFAAGPYAARRFGGFVAMDHPWGTPRVHIEGYGGGRFISDADEVAYFSETFDDACRIALSPRQSRDYIEKLANTWSTDDPPNLAQVELHQSRDLR
ncbi:helix-turn-helix domain-containing protein [Nocardia sp. SYP-A9097]|uniref:helix-turn-helix domain-containing protein n=1 Tax=Nocardia sp. SYP-A9097 TaxID=2663237 RepID=UPI00129AB32F|nr:helix-turn-helix transcriptional regulator [Nocardia sp. SYP-A9097]MRH86192.1 helix-turn-helix domain-containing protein [Nocardia sp. SYP-A9097]